MDNTDNTSSDSNRRRATTTTTTTTTTNSSPNQLLTLPEGRLRCQYFALRHGQSQANVQNLIASNPDVACASYGLSPLGIEQAQKAGRDVVEHFIKHFASSSTSRGRVVILASDLLRAKQTAEIVRDAIVAHNKYARADPSSFTMELYGSDDVIVETRLRERGFGNWDLTSDDNYQLVWDDDANDSSHTANNVESVDGVMRRVTSAVADWDDKLSQGESVNTMVVCVAHGDVLQILQTAFEKLDGTKHRTLPHLETATLRPLVLKASA
jgi:broad specificity phosphatase PhoE